MASPATAEGSCARRQVCGAILAIALLTCGPGTVHAQDLQSSGDENTIRGTVVNAVTHTPIPRALVHSADDNFAVMTDSDGHFEFATKPGTQIWLLARKPGFLGDHKTGRALEASAGNEITISLTPESIIKGRVSASTGETFPRIEVQLLWRQVHDGFARWAQVANTQTRSDGSFRFAELASGSYKVMTREFMDRDPAVSAAPSFGFPPVCFPAAADFSGGTTIDLSAGQAFEADLTITDQPYFAVKIPVVNNDLNSGLDVRVNLQGRPGPGYSLGYNASSHRIEGLLPNGNYGVLALTYGPDSASGEVNLRIAGAAAEGPALTLTRNSSLTLEVQAVFTHGDSQSGQALANYGRGARSYLYPQLEPADDFAPWGTGNVRRHGDSSENSLVLEGVVPGKYWLRLNTGRGYVASATMGGMDVLHQPFEVGSGSNIAIEVTMRDDVASLRGTVTHADTSSGPSQAWIYCLPLADNPGFFQETVASREGKFDFSAIPPGTYRVMAFSSPQPRIPYRDPEAMRAYDTKGQMIQLTAGQSTSIELQVNPDE